MKQMLMLCCCLLTTAAINAQPGSLDYSFGDSGKVISGFQNKNIAESVLIQVDQKIILAGECSTGGIAVRYKTDGSIDSSFGINGIFITTEFQAGSKITAALQKDDKVVLAGALNGQLKLIRLLINGITDVSFGNNGIATINTGVGLEAGNVAIQNDGKIVVAADDFYSIYTARWLNNGQADSSYGANGLSKLVVWDSYYNNVRAIAVTPEDKIVIAGRSWDEYPAFITARILNNGILDTSFNKTGYVIDITDWSEFTIYPVGAYACIIQPDGKTIVAGTATLNYLMGIGFVLARYNIDGSRDKTFGYNGVLELNVNNGPSACNAIALQKDGKILAAGAQNTNFVLTRFTSSGFTDTTFGISNYTTLTDFGNDEAPHAISLMSNGKIVLAGSSYSLSENNIALARYNDDESRKQILITTIRRWLQHHNGIVWDNMSSVKNYAVQRSVNGVRWATVHSQQATVSNQSSIINSPLSTVNYYNDASPLPGTNYYRLQTTSVSGAVANSNVIAVTSDALNVSLAPNPAKNVLRIEGLPSSNKIKITVVDFSGNVVISQQLIANSSSYNLNIASLYAGNYVIKMDIKGEVVTKQFVKE